jgi:hypothetical protein
MSLLKENSLSKPYTIILDELVKLCSLENNIYIKELNCNVFNYIAYEKIIMLDLEFIKYKFNDHVIDKGWDVRLFDRVDGTFIINKKITYSEVYDFMKKTYQYKTESFLKETGKISSI